jgi:hypothetical protein
MANRIGEIITFYSYKGGTGRSMVLANVGHLLSGSKYREQRVLLIDWDLEAPGLERFFGHASDSAEPGLVDYLTHMADGYRKSAPRGGLPESMARDPVAVKLFTQNSAAYPLDRFIAPVDGYPALWLMRAGRRTLGGSGENDEYWAKVRGFDWEGFYANYGSFFTHFRELLMSRFDYILIDSRTGLTDIGGICTRVMPEKLILVFAPNNQNIDGAAKVARTCIRYRAASRDPRPLTVFPLAARIDASASTLRTVWWRGGTSRGERVTGYQRVFEDLLTEMYQLDDCDLGAYFDATQVPYDSDYAYGESIASAIDGAEDRLGIGYACDQLTRRLVEQAAPWEDPDARETRIDFSISYAGGDQAWAEWVEWQLKEADFSVDLSVWDAIAGQNFVAAISDALHRARRVVALFSPAYVEQLRSATDEWTMAALHVPGVGQGRLVPLRVAEIAADQLPDVLRELSYCNLYEVAEDVARRRLLDAVAGPLRPVEESSGSAPSGTADLRKRGPRLPGSLPPIWNIPARNRDFTGRDGPLAVVRERLAAGDRAVIAGLGGVGKTQLAVEYAHRFAGSYKIAWWVDAAEADLIGDQIAALAIALNCVPASASTEAARPAVLAELRQRGSWLLVFDNAENPADIGPWLPSGGHVLITSRSRGWAEIATPVELDVLSRRDSVALLRRGGETVSESDAAEIAEALGDLPLSVAQAAAYLAETSTDAGDYLGQLRDRQFDLLDRGGPASYPRSLEAVIDLTFDRLAAEAPVAAQLASVCAVLAPAPVPVNWFTAEAPTLAGPLAETAAEPSAWREAVTWLRRTALVSYDHDALVMHPLTQGIVRTRLLPEALDAARDQATALLVASAPDRADDPAVWPRWAELIPHMLALDPGVTGNPGFRALARNAVGYLLNRGDIREAHDLASDLYQHWRQEPGPDDDATLAAASMLAIALRYMGRDAEARDLDEDTLTRYRRLLGEDHPRTLEAASRLASGLLDVGDLQAARPLAEDTLARHRRIFGEDHPRTLDTATSLAAILLRMGEYTAAHALTEDTLDRSRRIFGEDHPRSLIAAGNLAAVLAQLGDLRAARALNEDTLARRRRVLGEDHPSTLISASNLAANLRALGEYAAARDLDEDTLARRRRILGENHPDTIRSADNLDTDLRELSRRRGRT